ncbi:hypothetical protein ACWEKM_05570 [Streptomyces sp. NPDC004752]
MSVSERRIAGSLPERPAGSWAPHRPAVQRHLVRTWTTKDTDASAPTRNVVVRSSEELARLAGSAHVHHVVCHGAVADLGTLCDLPALRSLVIADNATLSHLDELEGCQRLRFLTVTGCGSLRDWAGAAGTGVMFIEVGPGHPVPPLKALAGAGRLRELNLWEAPADGDPDIEELRSALATVRVRVGPRPTG